MRARASVGWSSRVTRGWGFWGRALDRQWGISLWCTTSGCEPADFSRFHLFCRRGEQGHDHESRLGSVAPRSECGRVAGVLGAGEPDAVCREGDGGEPEHVYGLRQVRSDFFAGVDARDAGGAAQKWGGAADSGASRRALFAGAGAVQLHRRLAHVYVLLGGAWV